jgi:signal peptidase I
VRQIHGSARRALTTLTLAAGVLLALLVAEPFRVRSQSMQPTLHDGDQVLVVRPAPPRRGDVIVFREPATGGTVIKRVVAIGGDEVGFDDGWLVVNGAPVTEPYLPGTRPTGLYYGPRRLGAGELFVLGDNRTDSVDSLDFGPIPAASVVGRVALRMRPDPGPVT